MESPEAESENYGHESPLLHNLYLGIFGSYAWLYKKVLNSLTAKGRSDFLLEICPSVLKQKLLEGRGWKKTQLPTYLTLQSVDNIVNQCTTFVSGEDVD